MEVNGVVSEWLWECAGWWSAGSVRAGEVGERAVWTSSSGWGEWQLAMGFRVGRVQ